jgi:hypothetical protein
MAWRGIAMTLPAILKIRFRFSRSPTGALFRLDQFQFFNSLKVSRVPRKERQTVG